MAKIDEATLVREATTGSDLRVSIRRTLRGTIAAKWPRKRGKWNTPAQFYQQQEFGLASRAASNAEPIALASAYNIAKGSQQVARDLIVMASYGLLYEIKFMDGTVVTRYRDVTTNAQLTLDQVTSNPGDLIYRSTLGWIGIPPSNNSFVLTMHNQVPEWLPNPGTPGSGVVTELVETPGAGTYDIPENTTNLEIIFVGGGGGGGSGRRTASGTAASGGGGGGGAAIHRISLRISELTSPLSFFIGSGGAGGPARTTNDQNGASGSNGTDTTVTTSKGVFRAQAGNGGGAGSTGTSSGGGAGGIGKYVGGAGGGCGAGSSGTAGAALTGSGCLGGGGGAGMPAVPADRNGGASGNYGTTTGNPTAGAAGGVASTSTLPAVGIEYGVEFLSSTGGGGGYAKVGGVASAGADGGHFGGGGGGGGASLNGNNSGKGGDGEDGAILFIAS